MNGRETETARRLLKALSDKDMRPIELSNRTGISKSTISQYMSASYSPRSKNAKKMAEVLDVSPMWLMGFDMVIVEDENYSKRDQLGYYFTLLTKEDQDKLLDYAESMINQYDK